MRSIGNGPARINTPFKTRSDLYSFLFVSSLHAEYIYETKKRVDELEEVKEKALEHFI